MDIWLLQTLHGSEKYEVSSILHRTWRFYKSASPNSCSMCIPWFQIIPSPVHIKHPKCVPKKCGHSLPFYHGFVARGCLIWTGVGIKHHRTTLLFGSVRHLFWIDGKIMRNHVESPHQQNTLNTLPSHVPMRFRPHRGKRDEKGGLKGWTGDGDQPLLQWDVKLHFVGD